MQVFKSKPYASGVRHYINIKKNLLSKVNTFDKQSIFGFKRFRGRGSDIGRITTRHLGGGCKKKISTLKFIKRRKI